MRNKKKVHTHSALHWKFSGNIVQKIIMCKEYCHIGPLMDFCKIQQQVYSTNERKYGRQICITAKMHSNEVEAYEKQEQMHTHSALYSKFN